MLTVKVQEVSASNETSKEGNNPAEQGSNCAAPYVSSDGERFLMVRPYVDDAQDEASSGWVLVQNFFEELKTRVPN